MMRGFNETGFFLLDRKAKTRMSIWIEGCEERVPFLPAVVKLLSKRALLGIPSVLNTNSDDSFLSHRV
jgi:hypothetical protein